MPSQRTLTKPIYQLYLLELQASIPKQEIIDNNKTKTHNCCSNRKNVFYIITLICFFSIQINAKICTNNTQTTLQNIEKCIEQGNVIYSNHEDDFLCRKSLTAKQDTYIKKDLYVTNRQKICVKQNASNLYGHQSVGKKLKC